MCLSLNRIATDHKPTISKCLIIINPFRPTLWWLINTLVKTAPKSSPLTITKLANKTELFVARILSTAVTYPAVE